jgi:hypothetical protein
MAASNLLGFDGQQVQYLIKGCSPLAIGIAMPKPTLTSLKLADLALLEMVERLTPYLLFLYALSQALRRKT